MSNELKDIAENVKNSDVAELINTIEKDNDDSFVFEDTPVSNPDNDEEITETADSVIVFGYDKQEDKHSENNNDEDDFVLESSLTSDDLGSVSGGKGESEMPEKYISREEYREIAKDIPDDLFEVSYKEAVADAEGFERSLIIDEGYSPKDAKKAATNRMRNLGKKDNNEYLEKNPNVAVVEIDKKNVGKVQFTDEEKAKLVSTKVIQLKVVENKDLEVIPIEKVSKKEKGSLIQTLDTNVSQYAVPLLSRNDFVRFKGAQIIQLVQTVRNDDTTLSEVFAKKASLLFTQLTNSATFTKYDDNGKVILSYNDFINSYPFADLDMGIYAILVASSMEDLETEFGCASCNSQFQWKYNIKKLLTFPELSKEWKDRMEEILANKTNHEALVNGFKKYNKSIRVKSPLTQNIYDISAPSVARAINLFQQIDESDQTIVFISVPALFIDSMYVYNNKTAKYIKIESDEYRTLLDALQMLPQGEIDILTNFLKPYTYQPKFILKSKCPNCGHEMENDFQIDQLIFLRAQGSSTETRM